MKSKSTMLGMLVPHVLEEKYGSERYWDIFSRLVRDKIVFLSGEINESTANLIVAQFLFLEKDDPNEDIYLYLHSGGGDVVSGLMVYDVIKHIKNDVQTVCIGQACSMAAILLAAGTKGKRSCLPNASIMIHQPHGGVSGQASDIAIQAKRYKFMKDKLAKILAEECGKSVKKIMSDMDRDFYLTAEEAKVYGIIDTVVHPASE